MTTAVRLTSSRGGKVRILTLSGVEKHNAIGWKTFDALDRALDRVADAHDCRVLVLTGAGGRAFCAGADIDDVATMTATDFRRFSGRTVAAFRRLTELPQVVVAAVGGIAFGAGCALTMAADLVVASVEARFAQPEINVGIVGGTALLPRRIASHAIVAEMVLLGRSLSAEEARQAGLVGRVVEGEVLPAALEVADELLAKPAGALVLAKRALVRGRSLAGEVEAFDLQQDLAALSRSLPESRAAADRFLARRAEKRT